MAKFKPKVFISFAASKCNVPRIISYHLFGKDHTSRHRKFTGVTLMIFGVALSKQSFFESHLIHGLADLVGYAIHGLGLTPFIEGIEGEKSDIEPPSKE